MRKCYQLPWFSHFRNSSILIPSGRYLWWKIKFCFVFGSTLFYTTYFIQDLHLMTYLYCVHISIYIIYLFIVDEWKLGRSSFIPKKTNSFARYFISFGETSPGKFMITSGKYWSRRNYELLSRHRANSFGEITWSVVEFIGQIINSTTIASWYITFAESY
jgi:hypothetical protein